MPAPPARVQAERVSLGDVDLLRLGGAGLSSVRGKRVGFEQPKAVKPEAERKAERIQQD